MKTSEHEIENSPATRPWHAIAPEDMEAHFNPRAIIPDVEGYGRRREGVNEQARNWPGRIADISYGDTDRKVLDIYPPKDALGPLPVHLFIHGGFWRSRSKDEFPYVGQALAEQGFLTVVITYPLCPEADLDAVVEGTRQAFQWVAENIADYGGDPARISISGHSAGAHLGAAILAEDWAARGLPDVHIENAVLISGIYDPEPARHTTVMAEINLTDDLIARHDYTTHAPRVKCPVTVIAGGGEPRGWISQSEVYAERLRRAGYDVTYFESGQDNHFDLQNQYLDPESDIMTAILGGQNA